MDEVNKKMLIHSQVSSYFATYGQDFCCGYQYELTIYLVKHVYNGVYQSPISNQ